MDQKLRKYSFVAKSHNDIISFIKIADAHLVSYKMKTPGNEVESCNFKFKAHLSSDEVSVMINEIPDSQLMIETLKGADVYPD